MSQTGLNDELRGILCSSLLKQPYATRRSISLPKTHKALVEIF
jgi:hypothetical protein